VLVKQGATPVILATLEAEMERSWFEPGEILRERPLLQNNKSKKDWKCGSNERTPAL
jgi:hypothetical protein